MPLKSSGPGVRPPVVGTGTPGVENAAILPFCSGHVGFFNDSYAGGISPCPLPAEGSRRCRDVLGCHGVRRGRVRGNDTFLYGQAVRLITGFDHPTVTGW